MLNKKGDNMDNWIMMFYVGIGVYAFTVLAIMGGLI
jgi:hypothetical protein